MLGFNDMLGVDEGADDALGLDDGGITLGVQSPTTGDSAAAMIATTIKGWNENVVTHCI